jgi:hypothetical protein
MIPLSFPPQLSASPLVARAKACSPDVTHLALIQAKACSPDVTHLALIEAKACSPDVTHLALIQAKACATSCGNPANPYAISLEPFHSADNKTKARNI